VLAKAFRGNTLKLCEQNSRKCWEKQAEKPVAAAGLSGSCLICISLTQTGSGKMPRSGCPRSTGHTMPVPYGRVALPILISLLLGPVALPAHAQLSVTDEVGRICKAPPVDAASLDILRRRSDFDRLLEVMADQCPDVAMLFAEFGVGVVDPLAMRPLADFARETEFKRRQDKLPSGD
jgi:hypothetical protein